MWQEPEAIHYPSIVVSTNLTHVRITSYRQVWQEPEARQYPAIAVTIIILAHVRVNSCGQYLKPDNILLLLLLFLF
jgi:hypothetical protein